MRTKHGLVGTPTYHSWVNMKSRCSNPNNPFYAYYGGRGIRFCEDWKRFSCFVRDVGIRPEGTTLDRIDPNGNYEPENCRWSSKSEQQRNRRDTRRVSFAGEYLPLARVSEITGVNINTLWRWEKAGLDVHAKWQARLRKKAS